MKAGGRDIPVPVSYPAGHLVSDSSAWRKQLPTVDEKLCSGCRLCFVLCPEGAIEAKESGVPQVVESWCKACGICIAECPRKALGWRAV